jgi:Winged helix-turn helix
VSVVSMSKREFSRLEVLLRVQSGRLRVTDACELIGMQRRQLFRLLRGLKQDGPVSLISKRRGRPSNNRLPPEVREMAVSLVRDRYADFGRWRRRSSPNCMAARSHARHCAAG